MADVIVGISRGFVDAAKWAMNLFGVIDELILGRECGRAASGAAEMIFERPAVLAIVLDQVTLQSSIISEYGLALQALEQILRVTTLDVSFQTTVGGEKRVANVALQ